MIAKNPAPPPPHLFSLARRRWKDSLVGLLHILPRLGKSGGHIPHSSLPFSYSLRLSFFFSSLSLSPPLRRLLFLHLRVEAALLLLALGGKRMGPAQRGTFWEKRTEWAAGTHRQDASWSCGGRQWLNHALWNTSHSSSSSSVLLLRNVRSAPRHGFR